MNAEIKINKLADGGIEFYNSNGVKIGGIYRIYNGSTATRNWTISLPNTKYTKFARFTTFEKAKSCFLKRLPESPNI